ncbi:hypothetical protein [Chitinophaga ginsengisoli]|uniref:Uncharacterized protein n=1 Tax=Chitinophaga ginsengisoli TaxID=363837 RepID=A0A2P8GL21_9BACT|nr:hypothetical protein [Chitinophaga ginsengisoli]PSL34640.1 hypothetical protein CLV42_102213 [Chitinophaga ginsengisoli]
MVRINNPLWKGWKISLGRNNKQFVIRNVGGTNYLCKYPDMSKVIPSDSQLESNNRFADAVEYAKSIIADPLKKANYKVRKGKSVYHSAIKDYLERH